VELARKSTKKTKPIPGVETVEDVLRNKDTTLAHDPSTNAPPPEAAFAMKLDDLELEAKNWCDGDPLSNEKQAESVTQLVDAAKRLEAEIETTRKTEKEPFLEGGRAVDAKYKPLAERVDKITKLLKRSLKAWLEAVEADKQRKAEAARREAEEAEARLRETHQAAQQSSDWADQEALDNAEKEAEEARREARKIEKQATVTRAGSTIVKLRSVWLVNVTDHRTLLNYYLKNRPDVRDELKTWLYDQAKKDVRAGSRSLPGCSIWEDKQAV
jgi:membrane-associated HD superfamily phosphohydrolase